MTDTLREIVARAINPAGWKNYDEEKHPLRRDHFVALSLQQADQVLHTLREAGALVEDREYFVSYKTFKGDDEHEHLQPFSTLQRAEAFISGALTPDGEKIYFPMIIQGRDLPQPPKEQS